MILYVHNGKEHKGVAGEKLVKRALADYSGDKYDGAIIKRQKFGKPFFQNIPIYFSLSHSGTIWVCLMADFNVGIDIQFYRHLKYEKVAKRFFTEKEAEYIEQKGIDAFFKVWTRKEAYVKYTGNGVANEGFDNFSVVDKSNHDNNDYFFKSNIRGAYVEEINLELGKFEINIPEKIVGAVCAQTKEDINIKML